MLVFIYGFHLGGYLVSWNLNGQTAQRARVVYNIVLSLRRLVQLVQCANNRLNCIQIDQLVYVAVHQMKIVLKCKKKIFLSYMLC